MGDPHAVVGAEEAADDARGVPAAAGRVDGNGDLLRLHDGDAVADGAQQVAGDERAFGRLRVALRQSVPVPDGRRRLDVVPPGDQLAPVPRGDIRVRQRVPVAPAERVGAELRRVGDGRAQLLRFQASQVRPQGRPA
ncbi:hypothetical protein ABZZ16_31135, partial [Streptomyces sp. NPDC006386]